MLILLLASPAFGEDATVCLSGSGCTYTQAQFEALSGNKAGSTYTFSGTTNSSLNVDDIYGTSENNITLNGDAALIDMNSANSSGLRITSSYITVDGFEIREVGDDDAAVELVGADHIKIINCNIHDNLNRAIFMKTNSTYITIGEENNGNTLLNCGVDTGGMDIGIEGGSHIIIAHNHMYSDTATKGIDGIMTEGVSFLLIEYNSIRAHNRTGNAEDGIDLKRDTHDVVIRYNHIYNNARQSGVTVQSGSYDIWIYSNYIDGNDWAGLYVIEGYESTYGAPYNVWAWSNIITGNEDSGISVEDDCGNNVET